MKVLYTETALGDLGHIVDRQSVRAFKPLQASLVAFRVGPSVFAFATVPAPLNR
jgi:hypothetical protein